MTTDREHVIRPGFWTTRVFNPIVAWGVRRGWRMKGAVILEVVGRVSGEARTTPVNPLPLAGERYLVAPRGRTEWVRNIRVSGSAVLITRGHREPIAVDEVADARKPPIIRAYLREWAMEVGHFFEGISATSSDAEIAAIAPRFPIFRIMRGR